MSDLIGQLKTAIREHALPSCPTYQMMIDCSEEIKMLRQRVIDCDSCIERREQINAQMQVENGRLQAIVADLELEEVGAKKAFGVVADSNKDLKIRVLNQGKTIGSLMTELYGKKRNDAGQAGGGV